MLWRLNTRIVLFANRLLVDAKELTCGRARSRVKCDSGETRLGKRERFQDAAVIIYRTRVYNWTFNLVYGEEIKRHSVRVACAWVRERALHSGASPPRRAAPPRDPETDATSPEIEPRRNVEDSQRRFWDIVDRAVSLNEETYLLPRYIRDRLVTCLSLHFAKKRYDQLRLNDTHFSRFNVNNIFFHRC